MKFLRTLLILALVFATGAASAGPLKSLKRNAIIVGGVAVIAGIEAYNKAKKDCKYWVDPETGWTKDWCPPKAGSAADAVTGAQPPAPVSSTTEPLEHAGEEDLGMTIAERRSATKELRKALNEELADSGQPPDPDDCDAHHIVPQSEGRSWAKDAAEDARDGLDGCIDIDSAENGVYLPSKNDGSSSCSGSYHKTLHTRAYYEEVGERLQSARKLGGCEGVKSELSAIKRLLMKGKM